jgi:hypothetical protein
MKYLRFTEKEVKLIYLVSMQSAICIDRCYPDGELLYEFYEDKLNYIDQIIDICDHMTKNNDTDLDENYFWRRNSIKTYFNVYKIFRKNDYYFDLNEILIIKKSCKRFKMFINKKDMTNVEEAKINKFAMSTISSLIYYRFGNYIARNKFKYIETPFLPAHFEPYKKSLSECLDL